MTLFNCWKLRRRKRTTKANNEFNNSNKNELNGELATNINSVQNPSATRSFDYDGRNLGKQLDNNAPTTSSRMHIFDSLLRPKRACSKNGDKSSSHHQSQPLPPIPNGKVPSKKVSFSWNLDRSQDYDFIDEDVEEKEGRAINTDGDEIDVDGYSKLDDTQSQHRYDYPKFLASRRFSKRSTTDEHYASASQTYSMGSEDPYSSIISVGDRPSAMGDDESSATYEQGYSRIKIKQGPGQKIVAGTTESKNELDALYATINRRPSLHEPTSSSAALGKLDKIDPRISKMSGFRPYGPQTLAAECESGSESVTSGSQPSYRYLTVRESPRTIRERIRRREEQQQQQRDFGNNENEEGTLNGTRTNEHYYSEINEYESVGGDSVYGGSMAHASSGDNNNGIAHSNTANGQRPLSHNGVLCVDTLRILLSPNSEPPRPPTSPIPKPVPIPPHHPPSIPIDTHITSTLKGSGPSLQMSNSVNGQLPPIDYQRHLRSVLQPLWLNGGGAFYTDNRKELTQSSGINCNSTERKAEVETQTPPIPPSRIPIPLGISRPSTILLRRTPSPTQDVAIQATTSSSHTKVESSKFKLSKNNVAKVGSHPPPPLPPLAGKDYISPIDLGNQRNWPLTFSSMSSLDGE